MGKVTVILVYLPLRRHMYNRSIEGIDDVNSDRFCSLCCCFGFRVVPPQHSTAPRSGGVPQRDWRVA